MKYSFATSHIGGNLKHLRVAGNYTMDALSAKLHISQAAYSKIEQGETVMTVDVAFALADVFNMRLDEFISAVTSNNSKLFKLTNIDNNVL